MYFTARPGAAGIRNKVMRVIYAKKSLASNAGGE
jgi:hypothetical protein